MPDATSIMNSHALLSLEGKPSTLHESLEPVLPKTSEIPNSETLTLDRNSITPKPQP